MPGRPLGARRAGRGAGKRTETRATDRGSDAVIGAPPRESDVSHGVERRQRPEFVLLAPDRQHKQVKTWLRRKRRITALGMEKRRRAVVQAIKNHWLLLMLLLLALMLVTLMAWMLVAVVAAINGETSLSRSGTVGDTFGGTVGPILSFAALMATVILAAIVQPRREVKARDDRLSDREVERAEMRAEQVVAWMAETYAEFVADTTRPVADAQRGVVVANTSGSVVFAMDFVAEPATAGAAGVKRNREALIPPGTWFFALTGDPEDAAVPLGWQQPVAVDTSGIPTVRFEDTQPQSGAAGARAVSMRTFGIRPHLPTHGNPHYLLREIRYTLHAQLWRRDATGMVARSQAWPDAVEGEFAAAEAAERPSETTERTIATLVSATMAAISGVPDAHAQKYTLFPATTEYVQGVTAVSRNRATGLYLHLTADPEGPLIRIAGNRYGKYPEMIQYFTGFVQGKISAKLPEGENRAISDRLTALAAQEVGNDFPPEATWWFDGAGLAPRWRALLQRVVMVAREAGGPFPAT